MSTLSDQIAAREKEEAAKKVEPKATKKPSKKSK